MEEMMGINPSVRGTDVQEDITNITVWATHTLIDGDVGSQTSKGHDVDVIVTEVRGWRNNTRGGRSRSSSHRLKGNMELCKHTTMVIIVTLRR